MVTNENKNEGYTLPFFSVIITTYNRATLLKRSLDSLIAQTETDWEAIIIDDGSTDNTAFMMLPYLKPGSKIRYFQQKNVGYSQSKNKGIFSSKGIFVTFLDSDDEYDPIHLETRKNILINNPNTGFLHGGVKIIGNEYVPDRFNYNKMIHLSDCAIGGTFFIKRQLVISLRGFINADLGSDADLLERLKNAGISVMKTNLPTYVYHRENPNSITNNLMRFERFQNDY